MSASQIGSVLTNDGVRLVYERHGEGKDTALILLHGWSGSRRYFDLNVDALAQTCDVYRLDMRFHGDSENPQWGHFVCRLAADVHDLVQQLKLKGLVLLGTSMGCSVIWAYCMLYGTKDLKGAIFVDQAPLQNRRRDWVHGSKACYDEETLQKTIEELKDLRSAAEGMPASCLSIPIDPDYAQLLKDETMKSSGDALGKLMADHTQIDWRPILPRIDIPCLNVIGAKSGIFPLEGVQAVGNLIPHCKNVIFEEENHWLHIENPKKFNPLVQQFIADISTRNGA